MKSTDILGGYLREVAEVLYEPDYSVLLSKLNAFDKSYLSKLNEINSRIRSGREDENYSTWYDVVKYHLKYSPRKNLESMLSVCKMKSSTYHDRKAKHTSMEDYAEVMAEYLNLSTVERTYFFELCECPIRKEIVEFEIDLLTRIYDTLSKSIYWEQLILRIPNLNLVIEDVVKESDRMCSADIRVRPYSTEDSCLSVILSAMCKEHGISLATLQPVTMPEETWKYQIKKAQKPKLWVVLRCCILLRLTEYEVIQLVSAAGYCIWIRVADTKMTPEAAIYWEHIRKKDYDEERLYNELEKIGKGNLF